MTDYNKLYNAAKAADRQYRSELKRQYGSQAEKVRYQPEGRGAPGTPLRSLHDRQERAWQKWRES